MRHLAPRRRRSYTPPRMKFLALVPVLALIGCNGQDYNSIAKKRVLDSYSYVDAGAAAVGDRQVFTVPLFSRGAGPVRIFEITAEDGTIPEGAEPNVFKVQDSDWTNIGCDSDEDGTDDCRDLTEYDAKSDDDSLPLNVTFAPTVEGEYEGVLTIWSNDSVSTEHAALPENPDGPEQAVWRVQLRGLARYACGTVWPTFIDFGPRPEGGDFNETLHVENCGIVTLTISQIAVSGTSMASLTSTPLYVLPGDEEEVLVGWTVGPETNGQPTAVDETLTFNGNSDALNAQTVHIIGNNCPLSSDPRWDADADGWFECGGDCNDALGSVSPSTTEIAGNERDDDCDGDVDEPGNPVGSDDDLDGYNETGSQGGQKDCDDADANIGPDAVEALNNVDDDCDGVVDNETTNYDDDGDGFAEVGGDCNDDNVLVAPNAVESPDGIDNNCNGIIDEGSPTYDDDEDGFTDDPPNALDQLDCEDGDPWEYPGAFEYCDGYDNDCDTIIDEGEDDAKDGACAFRPARTTDTGTTDTGTAPAKGCATTSPRGSFILAGLLGMMALAGRRSGRRA